MDIDIDVPTNFKPDKYFNIINASMVEDLELKKHLVGIYLQNMPTDPLTGYAAIPYTEAEALGYTKIDMIHLSLLNKFKSKDEIRKFAEKSPNWELLEDKDFVSNLFHIANHFDLVDAIKPKSVIEIADILCLIRPGKRILLDRYLKNKKLTRKELYTKRQKSDLRKSHAVAYALLIVVQMHALENQYNYDPFE